MSHCHNLEAIDHMLCEVLRSTLLFLGIDALLIGDFLQTLPVVRASIRSQIVAACLNALRLFRQFERLHFYQKRVFKRCSMIQMPLWENCNSRHIFSSWRKKTTSQWGKPDLDTNFFGSLQPIIIRSYYARLFQSFEKHF